MIVLKNYFRLVFNFKRPQLKKILSEETSHKATLSWRMKICFAKRVERKLDFFI